MVFLAAPWLSHYLSLTDIGNYVLVQTTSQLIIPALTWNLTVALTREAEDHPVETRQLLQRVHKAIAAVGMLMIPALLARQSIVPQWLLTGLALGCTEAAFAASTAVLQGREEATKILCISTIKTSGFVCVIVAGSIFHFNLEMLLSAQILNNLVFASVAYFVSARCLPTQNRSAATVSLAGMVRYSAATLPHTVSLWLSVSSDRLLLGAVHGAEAVGSYALSYTLAQAVLLLMSGVISALPARVARDPVSWRNSRYVTRFVGYVAVGAFSIIMLMLAVLFFNARQMTLIRNVPSDAPVLVVLIGVAFFCSLYYVLFAAYMYLNRQTDGLAYSGLFVGPLNILIMLALVRMYAEIGAAVGLLCCYVAFGIAYGRIGLRLEPVLRVVAIRSVLVTSAMLAALLSIARVL